MQFFDDLLEKEYPMEHFQRADGRQVEFESDSDYAELHIPRNITDQKYRVKVKSGTIKV